MRASRIRWRAVAWAVATVLAQPAMAQEPAAPAGEAPEAEPSWRLSGSGEAWVYGSRNSVLSTSLLNPGNRVAALPRDLDLLDIRLNGRAEHGPLALVGSARLTSQRSLTEQAARPDRRDSDDTQQVVQAFARYRQGEGVLTVGRELLTWGPANFRSPSNPFYFDAGRTNPLASTPGVDVLRYTGQVAPGWRVGGGYVLSTSQITPATDLGHSSWLKIDNQGEAHLASLVISQQRGGATFVGGFAQWTPDDAWLLYGEVGSNRQPGQL